MRNGKTIIASGPRVGGARESLAGTSEKNWNKLHRWDREAREAGVRAKVFCASLADVFDDEVSPYWRKDVLRLMTTLTSLDWLVLTKRPENVKSMVPEHWLYSWPRAVWIGTTAENQEYAVPRLSYLVDIPAPIRFVSVEPMIGPVSMTGFLGSIRWVIVGGESGDSARPMDLKWARDLRDECRDAEVPYFMKQLSQADTPRFNEFEAIPEDLQIREFPTPKP